MTNTEKLKQYILSNYRSLREFTKKYDMHYTTLDSILKRGIENSSVSNINKICTALNIDLPALLRNEIIPCVNEVISCDITPPTNTNESALKIAEVLLSEKFILSNGKKLSETEVKNICKILKYSLTTDI